MKTNQQPTVLLVEDDVVVAATYKSFLSEEPIKLICVETGEAALTYIHQTTPNVILLDLGLPNINGMDILKYVQQQQLGTAIIVISVENSVEMVVETMRYGAFDFLEKPFTANRLILTLRHALHQSMLYQTIESYEEKLKRRQYHNMVGGSKPMQTIYQIIDNVATSKASILITGESGTGKELCAEAIHKESKRKDKPFIAINCAAIPKELMESEIFGHVKGAFTGAASDRQGAAGQADGGTLFLDEIGDMDLALQSTMLRFVQTGTFHKVGGDKLQKVDVRFLSATNRNLLSEIEAGQFREDLYYRLNVIHITLPALRKREEDTLLLARKFLREYAQAERKSFKGFAPEVEDILLHYDWPGNVRQLQNIIQNIVVLNNGKYVTTDMLPAPLNEIPSNQPNAMASLPETETSVPKEPVPLSMPPLEDISPKPIRPFWQLEKEAIEQAVEFCDGNVVQAAYLLELSPATIYRKLRRWNITFKRILKSS